MSNGGTSATTPVPPLSDAALKMDLRVRPGVQFGAQQFQATSPFVTAQLFYPTLPASFAPECGGQPACSPGSVIPPGCAWCDPGNPSGNVPRSIQIALEPGAYQTYFFGQHPNPTVLVYARERFDGEIIIIRGADAPFNYPALTETFAPYKFDFSAALFWAKTIQVFNKYGCGGPISEGGTGYTGACNGTAVCGTSCTSSCSDGGCTQRMFSESPADWSTIVYNYVVGVEGRGFPLTMELKNYFPTTSSGS